MFHALWEAGMAYLVDMRIRGEKVSQSRCMHVLRQFKMGNAFQVYHQWPRLSLHEVLKMPVDAKLPNFYTMIVIPDCCYICGVDLLPSDLDEQWQKIHPDIPCPDWQTFGDRRR